MKYIQLFESFGFQQKSIEEVRSFCDKYRIKNYIINDDGSIDVNDNVSLSYFGLINIPIRFNKVTGNFNCCNNRLISLDGCPKYVGGFFHCFHNQLTTLDGCPKYVGGNFFCYGNKLTTLEGCSDVNILDCSYNKLTSLKGCPNAYKEFNCSDNLLTSLEGCPTHIEDFFDCSNNKLTTLKDYPICSDTRCEGNQLPKEILDNHKYINEIIKLQDEFMIWNSDGSLNKYNFQELLNEIK